MPGSHKALKGLEAAQEAANATLASLQAAHALLQDSAKAVAVVERAEGAPDDPVSPQLSLNRLAGWIQAKSAKGLASLSGVMQAICKCRP